MSSVAASDIIQYDKTKHQNIYRLRTIIYHSEYHKDSLRFITTNQIPDTFLKMTFDKIF